MPLRESDTVELKREVVPDICKEVIALANTKGGTIYIGIADDGDIIGVHDADAVMLQVNNMVRDAVKPDVTMFVSYDVEDMDGRQVIRIGVQRGTNRPYYLGSKGLKPSGVYVRHGTSTDPATDSAIRQMIKESDAGLGRLEFQASAIRLLKYMSDNGMIKRVGSGKSTRYIK